jgi:predicted transcriptional regulator
MSTLHIGIISKANFAKRSIAIAKGQIKPRKDEPKVWFESLKSVSQVLSAENRALLKQIIKHQPKSLAELERLTDRKKSNLSRTLKTLARYGIVELPKDQQGKLAPVVRATDFKIEFGIEG